MEIPVLNSLEQDSIVGGMRQWKIVNDYRCDEILVYNTLEYVNIVGEIRLDTFFYYFKSFTDSYDDPKPQKIVLAVT